MATIGAKCRNAACRTCKALDRERDAMSGGAGGGCRSTQDGFGSIELAIVHGGLTQGAKGGQNAASLSLVSHRNSAKELTIGIFLLYIFFVWNICP